MKLIETIVFLFLLSHYCFADPIDSLNKELKKGLDKKEQIKIYLTIAQYYAMNGQIDSLEAVTKRSYKLAKKVGDSILIQKSLNNLSNYYLFTGNLEEAIKILTKAFNLAISLDAKKAKGQAAGNLAIAYAQLGNLRKAIEWQLIEIENLENYGSKVDLHNALINLSINQTKIGDNTDQYKTAKKLIDNAERIGDSLFILEAQNQYAYSLIAFDSLEKALNLTSEIIKRSEVGNSISFKYSAFNNYFNILLRLERPVEVLEFENEFKDLEPESYNDYELIGIKGQLANANLSIGNYSKALNYTNSILQYANVFSSYSDISLAYELNHLIYNELGKLDSAYKYLKLYKETSDSLLNLGKIRAIKEMQAKYELEKKNTQIDELQKEDLLNKKVIYWQRTATSLFAILFAFAVWAYLQYRKNAKKTLEKNKKIFEQEKQIEKANYDAVLKEKETELKLKTSQLAEKKIIIENLREESEMIEKSLAGSKTLDEILNELSMENNPDLSLKEFEFKFTEIFPDFFENLKKRAPEISTAELRVSAFLKMNMSTKEIAAIMNLSPLTIKKHRSNIRKKLNINAENSIQDFLNKN